MLNLDAALVILVASRSLMTYLRRTPLNMIVPFDKAMPAFHTLVGNVLVIATVIHTLGHIVRYSLLRAWGGGILGPTSLAFSGSFLVIVVLSMKITALKSLRKRSYETFYWVHSLGLFLFFTLLIMHGSHNGQAKTFMYILAPLVVYIIDRLVRLFREKGSQLILRKEHRLCKGTDMVRLSIPRTFTYLPGQYCDIKVPLVSTLEWHPFTIASSPHENEMLFYIKVNGDWTQKLYDRIQQHEKDHDEIQVHVRGPYGAPAQHVGQYEHVVLISGGVGATPFCAITKYAHHWILNYTQRGAEASNTVSAAFARNQSVVGTSSVPGTPTNNASGYSSVQRSSNPSRNMSRNQSGNNFPRNMSRNFSRNRSTNGSRPVSRSGSGRLDPYGPRNMSRSGSGRTMSRPHSGHLERFNSGHMDRVSSTRTNDSIGLIIHEQRQNQPFGPTPSMQHLAAASQPEDMHIAIPSSNESADDSIIRTYIDNEVLPEDYDEALGNPEAPIPDRRAAALDAEGPAKEKQQMFELIKEYESTADLFDDDFEDTTGTDPLKAGGNEYVGTGILEDSGLDLDPVDLEAGGVELEDQILEEQTASNAYNMLGMSFGPLAMLRHMHAQEDSKVRSSVVRASMNLMDDAIDAAVWQDRLLFYLHSVTLNWILLWVMLLRFSLVAMGHITKQFFTEQRGLGIFATHAMNSVDLVLAIFITVPVVGAVIMEIYLHGPREFMSDNIGNCFDLFVLVPLLLGCILLHVLDLASVGINIQHMSNVIVFVIWPILSLTLLWRIGRTIGSRVLLAQYFKSTHAQTKSLDYIWVSKTHQDDTWLIEELLPLAESNIVRLHRFITRQAKKTEPWMLDYEKIPLNTTYSRPDWDDVFGRLVERSKSGSVIGVFFCGPDNMARMVQQAAMNAMTKSLDNAYQRGYMQKGGRAYGREEELGFTKSGAGGGGGLGKMTERVGIGRRGASGRKAGSPLPADNLDASAYGCSVRISVRVENFT